MEKKIFELFDIHEIYLVGGTVRDRLLGRETNDLDFATKLEPEEIEKLLQQAGYKTHDIGKAFGTISFILDGNKIEITTYRTNEKYTRDNRRPRVEWGKSINDDLIRRDFTFNALALDREGVVVDLFQGRKHLQAGIIDTPMNAEEIFSDDPLRILRAIRFRSKFGFKYSEGVEKALRSQANKVLALPRERVLDEFNKILLGDHVAEALEDMLEYRVLNYILPELTVMAITDQQSPYHSKNVWKHVLGVVSNAPAELSLRYAALLHDCAKPATKTVVGGVTHFYHHEEVGARLAESILLRLGLPKKLITEVVFLVRNHMRANLYEKSWSDSAVRRYMVDSGEHLDNLLVLSRADITSHNEQKVAMHLEDLEDLKRRIEEQKNFKGTPQCPIDGRSIMDHFNLSQGKRVGELKDMIMEAITNGVLSMDLTNKDYLKFLENKIIVEKGT